MSAAILPFKLAVDEAQITDLHARLERIRWPEAQTVPDWSQGVPLAVMQELAAYWRHDYDWRRCEAVLNSYPQFTTALDGLKIHFLHVRSAHEGALPLLLTHGWPGSVLEFLKIIGPLTAPEKFGGRAEDAFHLVIPSLPGFGFSEKPSAPGWGMARIAAAWAGLMQRLGYAQYVAQGGDWGSAVTRSLACQQPPGLLAIHSNLPIVMQPPPYDNLSPEEGAMLAAMGHYQRWDSGYSVQQMSRPQTLAYGLADSPIGQAAWIYEKFQAWMDCDGDPLNVLTRDELLDNIMMYWLTNAAGSSARLYWESFEGAFIADQPVPIPCGYSVFPKELYRAPRSWAQLCTPQLIHWRELDKGGHFAAFEQPALFAAELRDCFRRFQAPSS